MPKLTDITRLPGSSIPSETSKQIFYQIDQFAGYGFNKSHAAGYASIAFQTAYLKTHYPECYFAAAMNLSLGEIKETASFAAQLKSRNIRVFQPDINASVDTFVPVRNHNSSISYALSAVRGVGTQPALEIIQERKRGGPFTSIADFAGRMGSAVNKKAAFALVYAGAFDRICSVRAEALRQMTIQKEGSSTQNQMSMFDMLPDIDTSPAVEEFTRDVKLDHEFDVLGHFMSGHPLEDLRPSLFAANLYFSDRILDPARTAPRSANMAAVVMDVDLRFTKKGEIMAVVTLSDPEGTYEALAFGDTWGLIKPHMKKKSRVCISATIISEGDDRRFMIERASSLPAVIDRTLEAA